MIKKNTNILIHIPHSGTRFPMIFWKNTLIRSNEIDKENIFICDLNINKLISKKYNVLRFKYSRMFCDVERFDKSNEIMNKYGMGVLYTKTSTGTTFIKYDEEYKEKVISKYYNEHHNKLNNLCDEIITKYEKCIIIDLHSFSDTYINLLFNIKNSPDICIGIDEKYTSKKLLKFTKRFFEGYGYKIEINYPFEGTIIPSKYINNYNDKINSIMIELNKRIYLNYLTCYKFKDIFHEYLNAINENFK